ncbi:MAG: N-6 DNA methylase [Blastocatellia bacterium]|nr:N-6 DNA methylase [Blastocatellia bacterium]
MKTREELDRFIDNVIESQRNYEKQISHCIKKNRGIFFTNKLQILDMVLDSIRPRRETIYTKILEPACGRGIFILRLLTRLYEKEVSKEELDNFIEDKLIFADIEGDHLESTKFNIKSLYKYLFNTPYRGNFNDVRCDFTERNEQSLFSFEGDNSGQLRQYLGKIDYIIGNPPYVTLYGRRDKKINEAQRQYYLKNYKQFPSTLQNGKLNFLMFFIEQGLEFLREEGVLSFIVDIAFFESAFEYTRKYILERSRLLSLDFNVTGFNVQSGQAIISLQKGTPTNSQIILRDFKSGSITYIDQRSWYDAADHYRFRIPHNSETQTILDKIKSRNDPTLAGRYPKKSLRTCAMLLDMEALFVVDERKSDRDCLYFPYYQGSKGLSRKFAPLISNKYFYYDERLQDSINEQLKLELTLKGIKNKKRIGLGDSIVYANPKVYIRQSAKEIIASYDDTHSAANNSLYVFSLRDDSDEARFNLKFICGLLNSEIVTFYAQQMHIIRYFEGKQPQIKIADLCSIFIPEGFTIQHKIVSLVQKIFDHGSTEDYLADLNSVLYKYYGINSKEEAAIKRAIQLFK